MSSSESLELWSNNNSSNNQGSTIYANHHLNKRITRTIPSQHQTPIVNRSDWSNTHMIPPSRSFDSEINDIKPSYTEILTNSGPDWLDSYDNLLQQPPQEEIREDDKNRLHRRTFHHATSVQKQPVLVRKAKSLRDTSKSTRLRSPPPPRNISNEPRLPDKMQFINNVNCKLGLNNARDPPLEPLRHQQQQPQPHQQEDHIDHPRDPRRTVSSSIFNQDHKSTSVTTITMAMNNGLSEYQGYSRPTSKHRSFTYSPPPPRTSSLQASNIPAVPPIPPAPKIQELQSRSSSLKKNKSENFDNDKSEPFVQPIRSSSLRKKKNESFHPEIKQRSLSQSRSSSLKKIKNDNDVLAAKIAPIYNPPLPTSNYTLNLNQDLAQIEEDIKALEIQRDRHSSFINAAELQKKQQQLQQEQKNQQQQQEQNYQQQQQQQQMQQKQLSTQMTGRKRGKVSITVSSIYNIIK